jgi:hypothetical protein
MILLEAASVITSVTRFKIISGVRNNLQIIGGCQNAATSILKRVTGRIDRFIEAQAFLCRMIRLHAHTLLTSISWTGDAQEG